MVSEPSGCPETGMFSRFEKEQLIAGKPVYLCMASIFGSHTFLQTTMTRLFLKKYRNKIKMPIQSFGRLN